MCRIFRVTFEVPAIGGSDTLEDGAYLHVGSDDPVIQVAGVLGT